MQIELWMWLATVIPLVAIIIIDLVVQARHPHEPSFKESAIQSGVYIALAIGFGWFVGEFWGSDFGNQFIAGFITEKSLSVDNLFVFLIIFTKFAVPRKLQSEALLIGIAIALVLRAIFIAVGAAAIEAFSWIFYIFGAFLVYTAIMLIIDTFHEAKDDAVPGGRVLAMVKRVFPTVDEFHGSKMIVKLDGKKYLTPLLMVMIVIGTTDVLFALDSIPAVYGLTEEPYIVFTANAFALLGLRQLYFLLSGLMERLKYLGVGLSIILAWIGFKLVAHALHKNELPFINGGKHVEWAPEISTELSLGVIIVTLTVTTVVSLLATRNKPAKL
ncbi:MAG: TerC/Alx family metal homeostasis membrane protein [Micrococcales bacterium]